MRRYLLNLILPAAALLGQDYIRVESPADGRTYVLDTTTIGDDLTPAEAPESKLSPWLFPQPGAVPTEAHYNVSRRIATATWHTGGSEELVAQYYVQTLAAQGLKVSEPLHGAQGGTQLTGYNSTKTISVYVDPKPGFIEIRAKEVITKQPAKRAHYEALWWDDARGVLRLKDSLSGEEFELAKRAVVERNLNRPGAVKSDKAAMPDWLSAYPGSSWTAKGKLIFLMEPTAAFLSNDSIRQVYEYYRSALEGAGATITSSELARSGTPVKDSGATIKALRGDDGVEIEIGEAQAVTTLASVGSTKKVGIGIRYTVPKR
jgi:hypothetical protein